MYPLFSKPVTSNPIQPNVRADCTPRPTQLHVDVCCEHLPIGGDNTPHIVLLGFRERKRKSVYIYIDI